MWAILSKIEGNLAAYEAVLADIKKQNFPVQEIYILGDFLGANLDTEKLVNRIRFPAKDELKPQICLGWWEEQCLSLHGLTINSEPKELLQKYGGNTVKMLWDSVSRDTVEWLRTLDFGFMEDDCLLIHGSTINVSDELSPTTPPWIMLDRLQRAGVNNLFCGRSGKAFVYEFQSGSINNAVTNLEGEQFRETISTIDGQIVGVGSVSTEKNAGTYTLYDNNSNSIEFKTIG